MAFPPEIGLKNISTPKDRYEGTIATGTLSRMAESLGAGAVMVTPSREPVPSEDRVFEYFRQAVQGISIPVVEMDHPTAGKVRLIGSPMKFSGTPVEYRLPPPLLGEHTASVLKERLGLE